MIEKGSGNVYADLGVPNADSMMRKAELASKISEIVQEKGWTQTEAARLLGMTQPKLSQMLRGQFRGISETRMLDCLVRLGQDVRIVIGPGLPDASIGRMEVSFAQHGQGRSGERPRVA